MTISRKTNEMYDQQFKSGGIIAQEFYPLKDAAVLTGEGRSFPVKIESAECRHNRAAKIGMLGPLNTAKRYFLADFDDLHYQVEDTASDTNQYCYFININNSFHDAFPLSVSLPLQLRGAGSKVAEFFWTPNASSLGPYSALAVAMPVKNEKGIFTVARQVSGTYNHNILFNLDSIAQLLSDDKSRLIFFNHGAGFSVDVLHYQIVKSDFHPFFEYQASRYSYDAYKNCILNITQDDWYQPGLLLRYTEDITDVIKPFEDGIIAYLRDKGNKYNIILHQNEYCKEIFFAFRGRGQSFDKLSFEKYGRLMNIASFECSGILPVDEKHIFNDTGLIRLVRNAVNG
jgi:hypothetical protein